MKYSHLALVVTVLLAAYGPVNENELTFLQEDCAGCGALTAGVRAWGLAAQRRDVPQLNYSFEFLNRCQQLYNTLHA